MILWEMGWVVKPLSYQLRLITKKNQCICVLGREKGLVFRGFL